MKRLIAILSLPGVLFSGAASAHADANSLLSTWNAITVSNASFGNEYEGAAFVGGNLTALQTLGSGLQNKVSGSSPTLVVGGNITTSSTINVNAGSVFVTGKNSAHYNFNGGGSLYTGSSEAGLVSPVTALIQDSLYWSTLTPTGSISTNNAQQLNFNATSSSSLAVIDATAAQTFNAGLQGFNLNYSSAVNTVLINISGGNINWNNGSFFGNFQTDFGRGNVLFNFYNATNVVLNNQFEGYIMAPNAKVTLGNNVDGGVMASNLIVGSEVHLPDRNVSTSSWYGTLPDSTPVPGPVGTPEPASLSLLPVGAAVAWVLRRRNQR